jgi:prevent-host-death family protein
VPFFCATMCYMTSVGIRELRQNASAVLRKVVAGETVEVTDHGHPIARIVPLHAERTLDQLMAEGRATEMEGDLLTLEPIAPGKGQRRLSDVLADLRADER